MLKETNVYICTKDFLANSSTLVDNVLMKQMVNADLVMNLSMT